MRIISTFKDYYDCVQGISFDKSIVYHRKEEEETPKTWRFKTLGFMNGFLNAYYRLQVVGFCGKEYYCLGVSKGYDNLGNIITINCYSAQEFMNCMEYKERDGQKYFRGFKNNYWYRYSSRDVEELYQLFESRTYDFCTEPIFLAQYSKWGEHHIAYNCSLREMDFQRIKDPYSAFQEIFLWMNNKATPKKPIPVMPDNIKIGSRGFDKFSFRKEPTKRKK